MRGNAGAIAEAMSSPYRSAAPARGTTAPLIFSAGGAPATNSRSLAPRSTTDSSQARRWGVPVPGRGSCRAWVAIPCEASTCVLENRSTTLF